MLFTVAFGWPATDRERLEAVLDPVFSPPAFSGSFLGCHPRNFIKLLFLAAGCGGAHLYSSTWEAVAAFEASLSHTMSICLKNRARETLRSSNLFLDEL